MRAGRVSLLRRETLAWPVTGVAQGRAGPSQGSPPTEPSPAASKAGGSFPVKGIGSVAWTSQAARLSTQQGGRLRAASGRGGRAANRTRCDRSRHPAVWGNPPWRSTPRLRPESAPSPVLGRSPQQRRHQRATGTSTGGFGPDKPAGRTGGKTPALAGDGGVIQQCLETGPTAGAGR